MIVSNHFGGIQDTVRRVRTWSMTRVMLSQTSSGRWLCSSSTIRAMCGSEVQGRCWSDDGLDPRAECAGDAGLTSLKVSPRAQSSEAEEEERDSGCEESVSALFV